MGYKNQNYLRITPPVGFDRPPRPTHPEMVDDNCIPFPQQLNLQLAPKCHGSVASCDVRKAAQQARAGQTPAQFQVVPRGYDNPLDALRSLAWHAGYSARN